MLQGQWISVEANRLPKLVRRLNVARKFSRQRCSIHLRGLRSTLSSPLASPRRQLQVPPASGQEWRHQSTATGGGGGNGENVSGIKTTGGGDEDSNNKGVQRTRLLTFIYATLVFVGGLMGFLKRKSRISLLSSAIASSILVVCGLGIGGPNTRAATIIAVFGSLSLAVFFFRRYRASGKAVPGLVGSCLSFAMSAVYATQLL